MTLTGPDISNHQGAVSFAQVATRGQFLIAKATESTTYADPWFTTNRNGARAAGLLFGAYHFARGGDPNAEAAYFLAHADHQPGELLILDWEIAHPTPDAWCAAFCSRLTAAGVVPVVYMNSSSARSSSWAATRATGAVLWVAQYGANNGTPGAAPNVGAWGSYAMWQYTSLGLFPGVPTRADVSLFYGDAARWHALGGIATTAAPVHTTPPAPAPAPSAPITTAPIAAAQEDDDMATVITNGSRGAAVVLGGRLIPLADQTSVDALRSGSGPITDRDFAAIEKGLAPVEVIWSPNGFAVGVPGTRYLPLGEQAEVDHWKALAGGVTRTVSAQTFANLTA